MPATELLPPATALALPPRTAQSAGKKLTLYCHIDMVEPHRATGALACLTGWIVPEPGFTIVDLGLQLGESIVRCNYPFHREDTRKSIALAGTEALTGFNLVLPERFEFRPDVFNFVAHIATDDGPPIAYRFTVPLTTGTTNRVDLEIPRESNEEIAFTDIDRAEIGTVIETRLFDHLARQRQLTLRLDLINKCNLRCVMCHHSHELFVKRPAQRIAPEQFAAFFEPIAPVTRDVVLSCGDEPLLSPHFETILQSIASRDPDVRIQFCTNGMLLSEKIAAAIIAARVNLIMFSFDGVRSETLHRIRVGSDFQRIVRNIVHLQRLRAKSAQPTPRFVFNFVMLESNLHEAPLFVEIARRLGGSTIDFRHVVPFDFYDIEHEMLEHAKPKFNYYRERIVAAAEHAGIKIYIPPAFETAAEYSPVGDPVAHLDEFEATLRALGESNETQQVPASPAVAAPQRIHESAHFFCDRPFREVMIRDQRDVYPCPWHREKMGTLDGSSTLKDIFFGENFRRLRLAMLDSQGAPGCSHCPIKSKFLPTQTA